MVSVCGLTEEQIARVTELMEEYPTIGSQAIDCVIWGHDPKQILEEEKC